MVGPRRQAADDNGGVRRAASSKREKNPMAWSPCRRFVSVCFDRACRDLGVVVPDVHCFDARLIVVPSASKLMAHQIWRTRDCYRNAILGLGAAAFTKAQCFKKNVQELRAALEAEHPDMLEHFAWSMQGVWAKLAEDIVPVPDVAAVTCAQCMRLLGGRRPRGSRVAESGTDDLRAHADRPFLCPRARGERRHGGGAAVAQAAAGGRPACWVHAPACVPSLIEPQQWKLS